MSFDQPFVYTCISNDFIQTTKTTGSYSFFTLSHKLYKSPQTDNETKINA